MARKVEKAPPPSAGESPALDPVAALQPDVKATIAGRELVFREYAALEGFQVAAIGADFIADLFADAKAGKFKYAAVRRAIGKHPDSAVAMAARSADVEPEWVRTLNRTDLEQFFARWFTANAGFFVQEILGALQQDAAEQAMASTSTGSSRGSAQPASGISTGSSGSPSVN